MPIRRDVGNCKALLVTNRTHVSSTVSITGLLPFYLSGKNNIQYTVCSGQLSLLSLVTDVRLDFNVL